MRGSFVQNRVVRQLENFEEIEGGFGAVVLVAVGKSTEVISCSVAGFDIDGLTIAGDGAMVVLANNMVGMLAVSIVSVSPPPNLTPLSAWIVQKQSYP